jgi:hypothetical protein
MLQTWGYTVDKDLTEENLSEIRRFVSDWVQKIKPVYIALSFHPNLIFPNIAHAESSWNKPFYL